MGNISPANVDVKNVNISNNSSDVNEGVMLVQNQVGSAAEGIVFVSVASYNECVIAMRPGTLSSMA